mmetsp:Transcript_4995/g.16373  ORF Transcript_4995/g.16373 Transcript_4995/m.16373 type:complete len:371 (+) Transcript_4995:84-1196(+)
MLLGAPASRNGGQRPARLWWLWLWVALVSSSVFSSSSSAAGSRRASSEGQQQHHQESSFECPGELGIAINSGDGRLDTGLFSLGNLGWAGSLVAAEKMSSKNLVVYSSVRRGSMPLRDGNVPITPCCGGRDLSKNIRDAQRMREYTFSKMLDYFPSTTQWFLSTEEDVWWDVEGLCRIIEDTVAYAGIDDSKTPVLMGGGVKRVFGPFVVVNRPMLELFANDTLFDACKHYISVPGNNPAGDRVYPGAAYNNDHLVNYCALTYFPAKTGVQVYSNISQSMWRPDYFFANSGNWHKSSRAPCYVEHLPKGKPVAFHHATVDDMVFLQRRLETIKRGQDFVVPPDELAHCSPDFKVQLFGDLNETERHDLVF